MELTLPKTVSIGIVVFVMGTLLIATSPAGAQVKKKDFMPDWLRLDAEYRVQTQYFNPMALSDDNVRSAHWTEQRLRMDMGLVLPKWGGIFIQLDLLGGVLFGDNGDWGRDPQPTSGLAITSRWPNAAGWEVGLAEGADPMDPDSYGPMLRSIDPVRVNRVYADIYLPIGLLRIGRQPYNYGGSIAGHEGIRINRWGVSRYSESADRILFGTKIDEMIRVIRHGFGTKIDTSIDRGIIFALAFDWGTQDDLTVLVDDLYQVNMIVQWRVPQADWFGYRWRDLNLSFTGVYRWNREFDTEIWSFPMRVKGSLGRVSVDLQYALIYGRSREISEGFAELSGTARRRQAVIGHGLHARVDVQVGFAELTFEFDYAGGDDDPRTSSDIVTYGFPRDFNVGLLLFEHLIAFESARSAAVGLENLSQLGADSFPLTEVDTEGRFTNAIALFPQVKFTIVEQEEHCAHARLGALFAWPAAKGGVVDPVMTILREDGDRIDDDTVNWHGGDPGSYYGTEIDLQLQWVYRGFFEWTVEAAVLFPGSSLRDRDGDAQTAFLVENRFTVIF